MEFENEARGARTLPPRPVLISIVGFWLFYFAIVTLRALVLWPGDQIEMMWRRAVVTLASMAVTWIFYRLLRLWQDRGLRHAALAAALLAIPAAIIYSTANWYAFDDIDQKHKQEHKVTKVVVRSPSHRPTLPQFPETDSESNAVPEPPAPPEPPQVTMIQVGSPHSDDEQMTPIQAIADNSANGYFFFIAWAALYLALCYAAEAQMLERRTAQLRGAAQAAELRALRYQVNPHFLFNTLNSLSSLVMTGKREEAERMILNLSNFFRTSLSGDPTEDVPLSAEIQLQRLYLDIEGVRFPDRLLVKVDLPERLRNACVPGLLLQPLVENAVKYGVARSRRPVTIRLSALEDSGGLVLTVENDGEPGGVRAEEQGTGVGLANVRDRLAARFGDRASCRWGPLPGGGFRVTLTMPIHGC